MPDEEMTAAPKPQYRKPHVMFGLPTREMVHTDWALSLVGVAVRSCFMVEFSTANPRSCYVQTNRNDVVEAALQQQCDFIFWWDPDIEAPADSLLRLLAHDKDIVGGTYIRRSEPYGLMGKATSHVGALPLEGLIEMDFLPGGFLLTKTSVYRKMEPPWFWLTHHPNGRVDLGDDSYFFDKAKKAGFRAFMDPSITAQLKHHTDVGIGPTRDELRKWGI